jgi:hypothetical protein
MFVMEELVWTDQESHSLLDLMYDQEIHLYHQIGLKERRLKKMVVIYLVKETLMNII